MLSNLLDGPPVPKGYRSGTHRAIVPAQTVARVKPLMAAMGITRIADVTGLDRIGLPVVMVCRPNSRSVAVAQGKGLDLAAAAASGLMEAAETFHAEHIELPLKLASYDSLRRYHPMIEVDRLPRIAGTRYQPELVTLWIEGFDLLRQRPVWLPFETVRANFTLPAPPGSGSFDASTNGLASGNTVAEAVSHGICEVIERDATALWNRRAPDERRATRLDPDSIADPDCRRLLDRLSRARFAAAIWETTSDVGIPAFHAVIVDERTHDSHIGVGTGCHPEPGIALLRALTEAAQTRMTYVSGARDDLAIEEYAPEERARRRGWASRLMEERSPTLDFRTIAGAAADTIDADVRWLLDRLEHAGIDEVVAVDLTREDLGLPVVRIVIPGLEGPDDHAGYVPGERARRIAEARR